MGMIDDHRYNMDEGLVSSVELLRWQDEALRRMQIADDAADRWEEEKPKVEAAICRRLVKQNGAVDDWRLRKEMEENWKLSDLIKKHAWNRDEANRYHNAIMAQWALRRMLTEENEARVDIDPQQMERLRNALQ